MTHAIGEICFVADGGNKDGGVARKRPLRLLLRFSQQVPKMSHPTTGESSLHPQRCITVKAHWEKGPTALLPFPLDKAARPFVGSVKRTQLVSDPIDMGRTRRDLTRSLSKTVVVQADLLVALGSCLTESESANSGIRRSCHGRKSPARFIPATGAYAGFIREPDERSRTERPPDSE
jgi:hypothetical protein